jgi:arylsulfatase A
MRWMPTVIAVCLASTAVFGEAPRKLNVVFLLADDLGWRDASCYGRKEWTTPNIDRLAQNGCRFTTAYAMPLCSPTRTMLLAGKHCVRLGVTDWIPGYDPAKECLVQTPKMVLRVPPGNVGLAKAFAEAGYATGHIGKWHVPQPPAQWGFQSSKLTDVFHVDNEQNKADAAVAFLRENKERPFFLYLCFSSVHLPLNALPETVARHQDAPYPMYAAIVDQLDGYVGAVMNGLRELGLERNTIVVFYSDNGGVQWCHAAGRLVTSNAPLRGNKGSLYEGGVRVPLIISCPATIQASTVSDAIVGPADLYPTLLELCGLPLRPKDHVDGLSFAGVFRGEKGLRKTLQWHYPHFSRHAMGCPSGALRKEKWKLIEWYGQTDENGRNRVELFNLEEDPGEQTDLAGQFPQIRNVMLRDLANWRQETGALMPTRRDK